MAIAFDTFESRVVTSDEEERPRRPGRAMRCGLLSFYERRYVEPPFAGVDEHGPPWNGRREASVPS